MLLHRLGAEFSHDVLEQLLADKMPDLTGTLTGKAGFDVSQPQSFLPAVMDRMGLIKPEKIAAQAGIDASLATSPTSPAA